MNRTSIVLLLVILAGCGGGSAAVPHASHVAGGAAGPRDSAMGMPGDSAMGLPGSQLICPPVSGGGIASCTLAVNVNIAPLSDPTSPAALVPGLHPADLQAAYSLSGQGGGLVAIVDAYDAPNAESDLSVYRRTFGLPPCSSANGCFRKVDQRGGTAYPTADVAWSQEAALDFDVVSAICPQCSILLVEANSASIDDLGAAVDTAARLGAVAISNSYYATEWPAETAEDAHYGHNGVAVTAASGDQQYPSYPATSPNVVSVGGTSLKSGVSGWVETAWAYGGSGCSAYEPKPSWQKVSSCATRSAVDVAAVADPHTGVASYDLAAGGWRVVGGTSVGAPLVAAAAATRNGAFSGPSFPYAHPSAFHDIPPAGFDPVTGLGSPNGTAGL